MIFPIAAFAVLWLLLSRMPQMAAFRARHGQGLIEKTGSILCVTAAIAILMRGNVWAALCLFGVALWLLGRSTTSGRPVRGAAGTTSRVRSAMIEMEYDHVAGRMRGTVLVGPFEGTGLERLDRAQCEEVRRACLRADPDGARLLDAYFDGRFPGWRQAGQGDGDAWERRARDTSRMSEDEANEVFGLRRGASREEIARAHRTLMKKWHPDGGGTAELAARANEAKEVLLRRHAQNS